MCIRVSCMGTVLKSKRLPPMVPTGLNVFVWLIGTTGELTVWPDAVSVPGPPPSRRSYRFAAGSSFTLFIFVFNEISRVYRRLSKSTDFYSFYRLFLMSIWTSERYSTDDKRQFRKRITVYN